MRHIVNFGLLASFCTLATTGVLAYGLPFSLDTTRVHIVFGLATVALVALHLVSRVKYFKTQLSFQSSAGVSKKAFAAVLLGWGALLAVALVDMPPATWLVAQSYESRQRAAIVRPSSLAGFQNLPDNRLVVARAEGEESDVGVALYVGFRESLDEIPVSAVWAETTAGTMIETLYLDPRVAYSEAPDWQGKPTPRNQMLPIWRNRYTAVSGVDPSGEIDSNSGATASHSFSLNDYLELGEEESFVLWVEVNAAGDTNEHYTDPHLGQPSLLYSAYIELDSPQPYVLLELTGHGGGAESSGAIQYDLEHHTTAKELVDLLLAKRVE